MMRMLRDMSIRYKVTGLLLGVVTVVVLIVSVANVIGAVNSTRAWMERKYQTLARIVAAQSGAALSIADIDKSGVQQILADVAAERSIRRAAIYDAGGRLAAVYPPTATRTSEPPLMSGLGAAFVVDGHIDVAEEVKLGNGTVVGRICLRAATDEMTAQVRRILSTAGVVFAVAIGLAVLLSFAVQRLISGPILQLAALTRRVSAEHDYSLAADWPIGHDEFGELCDGFNRMLAEIRRRDEELEQSNNELLESNDELRQFAYIASHDLQEPLRTVTGFCGLLKEECGDALRPKSQDYVTRIVNAAERMGALITELLSYSRVQQGAQLPFVRVDANEVLTDALANLQGSIDASDAQITSDDLPLVLGNRQQLIQLLQNLLGNAILYRRDQPPRIHVEAISTGEACEFSVRDNGIGIAAEHHERIFEIFKRLHGRNEYPGTGIGLAVCRKIVQRHGGRIWVESQGEGRGSTFRFSLPRPGCLEHESQEHLDELSAAV